METDVVPVFDGAGVELNVGDFLIDDKGRIWCMTKTGNSYRRNKLIYAQEYRIYRSKGLMPFPNDGQRTLHAHLNFSVDRETLCATTGDTAYRKRLYVRLFDEHKADFHQNERRDRSAYVQANLGKILEEKAGIK